MQKAAKIGGFFMVKTFRCLNILLHFATATHCNSTQHIATPCNKMLQHVFFIILIVIASHLFPAMASGQKPL